jgi:solute carrier family 25 folate transporter 32
MTTLSSDSAPPSTIQILAQKVPKPYINSICGAAAGVASGVVTCPLDVIKTKLQAQGSFRQQQHHSQGVPSSAAVYRGLVGTARTIVRQDGIKGMYRGLGPMILGYLPTWAVYMSIYDMAKTSYSERIGKSCP